MILKRWIDGPTASQEEWDQIDRILAARGWASLNRETSRILVAYESMEIVGLSVFQLVPFTGPVWVDRAHRGTGLAEELADETIDFLVESKARGWIGTAESPHAVKLFERHGMERLPVPVYVKVHPGGTEV